MQHASPFFQICFEATRSESMSVTCFMAGLLSVPCSVTEDGGRLLIPTEKSSLRRPSHQPARPVG